MAGRRRRNGKRAFQYFLLAALTLLMAGFIARREVPFLMESGIDSPTTTSGISAMRMRAAMIRRRLLAAEAQNLHSSETAVGDKSAVPQAAPASGNQSYRSSGIDSHNEEITGAERQKLGELIRERSH